MLSCYAAFLEIQTMVTNYSGHDEVEDQGSHDEMKVEAASSFLSLSSQACMSLRSIKSFIRSYIFTCSFVYGV